ncbi:nucleotide exchange factor GrpE [bacterium]|nr:nucleotide exchange factor GrpE [bacterium]
MVEKKKSTPKKKTVPRKPEAKPKLTAREKAMSKTIVKLEDLVVDLELKMEDNRERVRLAEEKMLRVVAEYENGKKRMAREKERSLVFAKDRVILGLFPIIDNLERSAKYEKEHEEVDTQKHGVTLVLEQIKKFLLEIDNVESFDPIGEPFDPELHEAMAMQPAKDVKSGMVIEVFEKGYKAGDRILRAAKVIVSQ